jgi:predicted phage tail component-like protein
MGFSFNNVASSTYFKVNKIKQSILPALSPRFVSAPKRAGVYDFGTDVGMREFEIDISVIANDDVNLRLQVREIAEWLFQDELKPLVFDDEPDKTYYVRLSGDSELDEILNLGFGQGTLVFIAPDPFAEGEIKTSTVEKGSPANPVFLRDSSAYDDNGAYYGTNVPRYENGQFADSKAVIVEEGTTNLLPSPLSPAKQEVSVTANSDYTLSLYGGDTATIEHKYLDTTDFTMPTKTAPTFTRNSNALSVDGGNQLSANAPRYANARFGKGVQLEEGTTNLVSDGSFNLDANANGFADPWYSTGNPTKPTFTLSTTEKYFGSQSQKVVTASTGGSLYQEVSVTAGQKYSFSGYIKLTALDAGSNFTFLVEWYDASGVLIATGGSVTLGTETAVTNAWKRYKGDGLTAPTGATKGRVIMKASAGATFYADGVQIENKDYVTTFTDSSRVNEKLLIPAPSDGSIIGGDSGTVELVFRRTGKPTQWANLFAWGAWSSPVTTDNIVIAHNTGTGLTKITAEYRSKATATTQILTVTLPAETVEGQDYYVALRWLFNGSSGYLKLDVYDYTAGVWYSNSLTGLTEPALAFDAYQVASVGSDIDNTFPSNIVVSGFNATNFPRTDTEIQAISSVSTSSNYALKIDANTTYSLDFNSNLAVSQFVERISSALLFDNVGVTDGGLVGWNATVPTESTVTVYASVDDGATWQTMTNGASITALTAGTSMVGKKLKTKVTMESHGTSLPSLQDIYVKVTQQSSGTTRKIKPAYGLLVLTPSNILYWQLEKNAYRTSFIEGTRQPEQMYIEGAEAIFTNVSQSTPEGTIEIRAYEDGISRLAFLFDTWDGNDYDGINNDRMLVEKVNANYAIYANNTFLGNVPVASVGWHVFALRWLNKTVEFLIDGVVKATYTLSSNVSTNDIARITIGTRYAPSSGDYVTWNNGFDEIRISSKKRSDVELQASVSSAMLTDDTTIYKVDFNGTLETSVQEVPHDVTNTGTAKTYPIITATLKQDTSYVKLTVGDVFILIDHDFKVNDILVIDMERALVTVNGLRILNKVDLSSSFFPLQKGLNTFTIEPKHVADVDVQFREKWL